MTQTSIPVQPPKCQGSANEPGGYKTYVSPYQIQEYFAHRLLVAQVGVELSRELLQDDIDEEEQLATALDHSLYPPDTPDFREATAAGYGHKYVRKRDMRRIRILQNRRSEKETWVTTADEELHL